MGRLQISADGTDISGRNLDWVRDTDGDKVAGCEH